MGNRTVRSSGNDAGTYFSFEVYSTVYDFPVAEDETRWLDEREQRAWRAFLRLRRDLDQRLDRRLQRRAGFGILDYEVLVHLSEAPGRRLRMSDLAAHTTASPSRLTYRIDRLVERGWVCRGADEADGRVQLAVLTDEGMATLAAQAPGHVADVRSLLFDHVEPDELDAVADALDRVAAAIDEIEDPT